ncbi:MAG: hypothetical protein EU547_05765 [Promethearchaeota archaeon]|nr:MAG: hypothetical protein EU547_05765 [Candidatus Lokiarchaeota archaeon]
MSMYRSYLLKRGFFSSKGNSKSDDKKVFIKHDVEMGGVYAIVESKTRGVKILTNGDEFFFENFDKLDVFLNQLSKQQNDFIKILNRKSRSKKLRTLDI